MISDKEYKKYPDWFLEFDKKMDKCPCCNKDIMLNITSSIEKGLTYIHMYCNNSDIGKQIEFTDYNEENALKNIKILYKYYLDDKKEEIYL